MSIREFLNDTGDLVMNDIQCQNLQVKYINNLPYIGSGSSSGGMQALVSYFAKGQNVVSNSITSIIWNTIDTVNSFGTSSMTLHNDLNTNATQFMNTTTTPICVNVSGYINCSAVANTVYVVYATRNGISTDRLCALETTATSDYMNIPFNFNAIMHVNDYFQINLWTTNNVQTNAFGLGSKIAVAQFAEDTGVNPVIEYNLTDILEVGSDAGQNPITNLSSLTSNNVNITGATGYMNFLYNGSTAGIFHQIQGSSNQLSIKQYNSTNLLGNVLQCNSDGSITLCYNGVLKVKNGTTLGRVYDDTIYTPSGSGSGFSPCSLAYFNTGITQVQNIPQNSSTAINWHTPDTKNTLGNIGLTFDGVQKFTNPVELNTTMILLVNGYASWDAPATPGCNRSIWFMRNGQQTDQYGYTSTPTTAGNATVQSFSFTIVLNSGDTMTMYAETDDSEYALINSTTSRIIITRLL